MPNNFGTNTYLPTAYMWAKNRAAKSTVSVIKRGPISECFKGSLLKVSHGYHLNVPVFMALSSTLS